MRRRLFLSLATALPALRRDYEAQVRALTDRAEALRTEAGIEPDPVPTVAAKATQILQDAGEL
mgnify:CR=1 FL=1